jgi:hypothetical protein
MNMISSVKERNRVGCLMLQLAVIGLPFASPAPVIWDGPDTTFSKAAFADPALPANQDHLTPGVAFTRANSQGLFNIILEQNYSANSSPAGTSWAFRGLNGNPTSAGDITAGNYESLTFTDWETALGGQQNLQPNIVNRPGVVHLIAEDIYADIMFTSWGSGGSGGAFSYVRTTPVPEPAQAGAIAAGLLGLAIASRALKTRRCRQRSTSTM